MQELTEARNRVGAPGAPITGGSEPPTVGAGD